MNKVTELHSKTMVGEGISAEEASYLFDVLLEMKEALIYVRKNTLYWKESDRQVEMIAETHKGTIVGAAANVQLKARKAIQTGGGE